MILFFFFFSSRRRHTRCSRDWSSDVCSSDLFPDTWLHLFSSDTQVVEKGSAYLARVAPFYALFGAGMSLYFSSQGAGKMALPFAAGMARLCLVAIGGSYWIYGLEGSLNGLYWIAAAGYFAFGAINVFALASGLGWRQLPALLDRPQPQARF